MSTAFTATEPLTTHVLTYLSALHDGVITRSYVRFTRDGDDGKVHEGMLRHYDGAAYDVRDRQVRITMTSDGWAGADLYMPVPEVLDLMDAGAFAIR